MSQLAGVESPQENARPKLSQQTLGLLYGFLGVSIFSLTLPATRLAVVTLDPIIVGLAREAIAALLALPLLLVTGQTRPNRSHLRGLTLVIIGVVFGFPCLTAWAMKHVDASHGAVVLGLLPLTTAMAGFFLAGDRPSKIFWWATAIGSLTVVGFALSRGGGTFTSPDLALLAAVIVVSVGYAEGAILGRTLGTWQVICWALAYSMPLLMPITAWAVWHYGFQPGTTSLLGLLYVSILSAFLGLFAWYHGLTLGGVARVGQLMMLQPFMTLTFTSLFMGEHFGWEAVICTVVVAISIAVARRSSAKQAAAGKRAY
jgi:drug/metabolite transporter (DMT)-like permease